jgi:uncharacterized protein YllA (UPF0747 family)
VARALGVPTPLVLPRWSATIIEPRVARILEEFSAGVDDLVDPHALESRVAREHLPSEAEQALRALRADLVADIDALRRANGGLVTDEVLDGLRRDVDHKLDRVERRFAAGVKRREAEAMRRIATARASLFPHGARQERRLSYIAFFARYGEALIDAMLVAAGTHARSLVGGAPTLASPASAAPVKV